MVEEIDSDSTENSDVSNNADVTIIGIFAELSVSPISSVTDDCNLTVDFIHVGWTALPDCKALVDCLSTDTLVTTVDTGVSTLLFVDSSRVLVIDSEVSVVFSPIIG